MIDDANHPLAKVAEMATTERVYLPPKVNVDETRPEKAETNAFRPGVVAVAEEYFGSTARLHGDRVSEVTIQNEKTVHRLMIYLHAQGASVKDIAHQTGYTPTTVSTVLRQPWARIRLTQILAECGIDQVKHFLTHEVAPSLEVLRELRDDTNQKGPTRAIAANSILDRALGKPVAHIESDSTTRHIPADLVRIEADIAATRKALEERGALADGTSGTN